jgi:hypothetical protein
MISEIKSGDLYETTKKKKRQIEISSEARLHQLS